MHTREFLLLGKALNIFINCLMSKQTTCEMKAFQVQVYVQQ